jgi:hypothetical protein
MNIAIIEENKVINVIVCESLEFAKEFTGASEVLNADELKIGIGWFKVDNKWCPPKSFDS